MDSSKVLLEGGYSGSPVLEAASKTVFAVTSHSIAKGESGYAVSLANLPKIWAEIPADLAAQLSEKAISIQPEKSPVEPGAGAYRHCDRENQENDFRSAFARYVRQTPGEPQFYLLHGDEGKCHQSFILRLCDVHLKHYAGQVFGAQRSDVFVLQPAWSYREVEIAVRDLNFNLLKTLYDKSGERLETPDLTETLTQLLSRHMRSVVVLCYDLAAQNWNKHTPALLQRYYAACRKAYQQACKIHSQAAHCLVFVNVIYPGPEQLQGFSWWERFI